MESPHATTRVNVASFLAMHAACTQHAVARGDSTWCSPWSRTPTLMGDNYFDYYTIQ